MTLLVVMFLGILAVSLGIVLWMTKPDASAKSTQQRLSTIRRVVGGDDETFQVSLAERSEPQGLAARISESLQGFGFSESLELLILHSGSKTTVGSVVLSSAGLAIAGAVIAHLFVNMLPVEAAAFLLGGLVRYGLLRFKKQRRLAKFNEGLPDAIELMARALRAGHSMGSCIEIIAQQSPEPLASEFDACFQQQKFGIPFRDALLEMGSRLPVKDLHFLITALLVQKETGGDLTEILDRTTRVIRERVRIQGEVKTYTAQGRLTGWILSLLPVVMLTLINLITPGYSHVLFYDPTGQKMLAGGAILIVIGGLIIRKIVDIKV